MCPHRHARRRSAAVAQAPERPSGNFGGGALVAPPKDLFGPGNGLVALRALPKSRLEIEATLRAKCAGGDVQAATKIAADGSFAADGSATQEPTRGEKIKTTYKLTGQFTDAGAAEGKVSATLVKTAEGQETKTCKTGTIEFEVRRPDGESAAARRGRGRRYYGTTAQRGTGPRRPIVLRLRAIARGSRARCSASRSSATTTHARSASRRRARTSGSTATARSPTTRPTGSTTARRYTYIDDRFTATLGRSGAKGTFSLSDRTVDKLSGNVIQSCKSGTIKWTAAP